MFPHLGCSNHTQQPNTQKNQKTKKGLIQPQLLPDGQVCVDMGEPILDGLRVPTTLAPTRTDDGSNAVVQQELRVAGRAWAMTCVSMGNPHAVTYSADGRPIKVRRYLCVCVRARISFGVRMCVCVCA